jgi:hypothetical protein
MYNKISGSLRLFLILTVSIWFYENFIITHTFERFYRMSDNARQGNEIILSIISYFVIYMTIYSILEFKNQLLKYQIFYWLYLLMTLFIILVVLPATHRDNKVSLISLSSLLLILFTTISIYFVIADFISLFFKKKPKSGTAAAN